MREINNRFEIIVSEKPIEVGVDPYNKLIDRRSRDNRKDVSEANSEEDKATKEAI